MDDEQFRLALFQMKPGSRAYDAAVTEMTRRGWRSPEELSAALWNVYEYVMEHNGEPVDLPRLYDFIKGIDGEMRYQSDVYRRQGAQSAHVTSEQSSYYEPIWLNRPARCRCSIAPVPKPPEPSVEYPYAKN